MTVIQTIRWSAWDGFEESLEHVDIRADEAGTVAEGVIIGSDDGADFALAYRLLIDRTWQVREARLQVTSGSALHLASDGHGGWQVNGQARPDLHECVDIDIEATPLTNTLPIRRLRLDRGQSATLQVVYICVPSLAVGISRQRYTALEPGTLYRFESLESGFTADLSVDEEGFVMNYPRLFRRLS